MSEKTFYFKLEDISGGPVAGISLDDLEGTIYSTTAGASGQSLTISEVEMDTMQVI